MAKRINQKSSISLEEALKMEIIVSQALIDILLAKHIISEEDLMNRIRTLRHEHMEILN